MNGSVIGLFGLVYGVELNKKKEGSGKKTKVEENKRGANYECRLDKDERTD
jgi:hypothetical protein